MEAEKFLNKHAAIVQIIGGIIATAVSVTVFAYSTFVTKEELKDYIIKRLDIIEYKIDHLRHK